VIAESPADVEAVSAGHHDVEQEEGWGLAFGVGDNVGRGSVDADGEAGGFEVVLDEARDVGVVFEYKYELAQRVFP